MRIFCLGLLTFVVIQPLLHQFSTANRKSIKLRTAVCPRNQRRLLLLSDGTTRLTTRWFLCLSIQFLNSRRRVLLKVFQIATPNRFFLCVCLCACVHAYFQIFIGPFSKTNFLVFTKGLHSLVFALYFTTGLHPSVLAWKFDFVCVNVDDTRDT